MIFEIVVAILIANAILAVISGTVFYILSFFEKRRLNKLLDKMKIAEASKTAKKPATKPKSKPKAKKK